MTIQYEVTYNGDTGLPTIEYHPASPLELAMPTEPDYFTRTVGSTIKSVDQIAIYFDDDDPVTLTIPCSVAEEITPADPTRRERVGTSNCTFGFVPSSIIITAPTGAINETWFFKNSEPTATKSSDSMAMPKKLTIVVKRQAK